MKKLLFLLAVIVSTRCKAQTVRVITDSAGGHGLSLSDKQYLAFESGVDSVAKSVAGDGWRLPTDKEIKTIFEKTYSKRLIRSTYTAASCWTAEHHVGIMRGRELTLTYPSSIGANESSYALFLVKPF